MADHVLKATCDTVHLGGFSSELPAALTVESGDRIHVETLTGFDVCPQAPPAFLTPELLDIYHRLPESRKVGPGPHLLTGPIHVRGAEPGDVLEVRLEAIAPRVPMGFNVIRPGWGALPKRFDQPALRFIPLDLENNVAEFLPTIRIPLTPFFGILGVATDDVTRNSVPPGIYGGNIDNRHLQAGSSLFLPVFLPEARLSIGDGHSAQGDGEVNVTAIETSMNGTITVILHKHMPLDAPLGETPTHWITMGFAETLDAAFEQALQRMIALLEQRWSLAAEDAYVLCSLAAHFHITQVVNYPHKGVHGLLPKSILPQEQL
ncbi:MAG TPA: acetamidase/formamidase family protein [Candidatus Obscuribacterales bacterium]